MSVKITGVSYYNPVTGVYEVSPPSITRGQTGGIAIVVQNDTSLERDVIVEVTLIAPDGTSSVTSDTKAIIAAGSDTFYFTFPATQNGQYFASVVVELGMKNFVNLLSNGDFEVGDPPTGWVQEGIGGSLGRSSEQVKIGAYSIKVTNGATYSGNANQYPSDYVSYAGKTLTLGCFAYATVVDRVGLRFGDYMGNWEIVFSSYHPGDGQWHWLSITKTIRVEITQILASLRISPGTSISAHFDGAILVEGDCCPGLVDTLTPMEVAVVSPSIIEQIIPIVGIVLGLSLVGLVISRLSEK